MRAPTTDVLADLARRHLGRRPGLYAGADIPPRKVARARTTPGVHLAADEPIAVLYDATVFGGADEGFLVTPARICWRNFLEHPRQLGWSDFDGAHSLHVADGKLSLCGNQLILPDAGLSAAAVAAFVEAAAAALGPARATPYRDVHHDTAAAQHGSLAARQLVALARRHLGHDDALHFAPSIPRQKERRARCVHAAHLGHDERVLVLLDTTLLGGAAEGLLLTELRLLWKNLLEPPAQRAFAELDAGTLRTREEVLLVGARPIHIGALAPRFVSLLVELSARHQL
ncbi:MAG: hypothetical protein WKG00_33225 [Polyangiaceae bacterium]